jgi:hypothetical protein
MKHKDGIIFSESVTYVLNLKCYLCPDYTLLAANPKSKI